MRCTIFALTISSAVSILAATTAFAQQPLKLSFQNGLVSVEANSVPVRTILNEWAKIGGTKVVGAERISGAPLTVKLVNVTEAQALETILRSAAGYMAAPRSAAAAITGPSIYDRILVMATTSAPATAAANGARPAPAANSAFNGTQRSVQQRPRPDQQEPDDQEEVDDNPPNPPVFTFPQPAGGNQNGVVVPGTFLNAPQPGVTVAPGMNPGTITINPAQQNGPQPPIGVSQPGMMVPAPQPTTAPQPGMIRPPGGK
jgi:hypothetical protein